MANVLDMFENALGQCQLRYAEHEEEKGDSWREECTIPYLQTKLIDEIEEYCSTEMHSQEEFDELIDVILVGLMLAERQFTNLVRPERIVREVSKDG